MSPSGLSTEATAQCSSTVHAVCSSTVFAVVPDCSAAPFVMPCDVAHWQGTSGMLLSYVAPTLIYNACDGVTSINVLLGSHTAQGYRLLYTVTCSHQLFW